MSLPPVIIGFVSANRTERRKTGTDCIQVLRMPGGSEESGLVGPGRCVPLDHDEVVALGKATHWDDEDPVWGLTIMAAFHREWLDFVSLVMSPVNDEDHGAADQLPAPVVDADDSPPPVLLDLAALVAAPAGPPRSSAPCSISGANRL